MTDEHRMLAELVELLEAQISGDSDEHSRTQRDAIKRARAMLPDTDQLPGTGTKETRFYSADVRIYGTAYIQATSPEHAAELLEIYTQENISLAAESRVCDLPFAAFPAEDLPTFSLSSVATLHGMDEGDRFQEVDTTQERI